MADKAETLEKIAATVGFIALTVPVGDLPAQVLLKGETIVGIASGGSPVPKTIIAMVGEEEGFEVLESPEEVIGKLQSIGVGTYFVREE